MFFMRNTPLNGIVMELRLMCSPHQQEIFFFKWTNKVCASSLDDGKNLCYTVCLLSKPSGGGILTEM